MSKRAEFSPEPPIHPEELMTIQVKEFEGVRRAALHLTCWNFMYPNYAPVFICLLIPREAQKKGDRLRSYDLEHISRIRAWLVANPPPNLSHWCGVDRLFSFKRHLWKAVLETHRPAEVDLVCAECGPLGDFNDDLELSPFCKGKINRHELTKEYLHDAG